MKKTCEYILYIYIEITNYFGIDKVNTTGINSSETTKTEKSSGNESIWTQNKTNSTTKENQDVNNKINEETTRLSSQYSIATENKEAKKAEKILSDSNIPNLSRVGTQLKNNIETLGKNLNQLIDSVNEKCSGCKTTSEVEAKVKELEQEISQKKQEIVIYVQRMQKAVQLNSKFLNLNDEKQAKLLETIDMDKIEKQLLEPANLSKDEISDTDDPKADASKQIATKDNEQDDKISKIITSVIKYTETGEIDKLSEDFIKDSPKDNQKNANETTFGLFQTNYSNLFSNSNINKKKNPFFT